ncbi:hypothetical protein CEXT_227271 [Caerostris extrusa]|uniref:Uncharacterized protein n=1 Tax=Caerostris extrusa TaxID=172846 RepID=A0AAV4QXR0_CAEEX|nr:hypothetical protein CEXT_227271 [Caerostris extrusa]
MQIRPTSDKESVYNGARIAILKEIVEDNISQSSQRVAFNQLQLDFETTTFSFFLTVQLNLLQVPNFGYYYCRETGTEKEWIIVPYRLFNLRDFRKLLFFYSIEQT